MGSGEADTAPLAPHLAPHHGTRPARHRGPTKPPPTPSARSATHVAATGRVPCTTGSEGQGWGGIAETVGCREIPPCLILVQLSGITPDMLQPTPALPVLGNPDWDQPHPVLFPGEDPLIVDTVFTPAPGPTQTSNAPFSGSNHALNSAWTSHICRKHLSPRRARHTPQHLFSFM